MNALSRIILSVVAGLVLCRESRAGSVATLNNTTDAIVIDGERADWASLEGFPEDTSGESGIGPTDVDWKRVTVANTPDARAFYVRVEMNVGADFVVYPAFYNIFIDVDKNRNTGYIGSDGQFPIGADYLIQGPNLFAFTGGAQTTFSWAMKTSLTADNSLKNRDVTIAVPASAIERPASFYFLLLGDNALSGHAADYYPDNADHGAGGGYFEYTTKPGDQR